MSHNKQYIALINSRKWRALRAKKLTENPLCEVCEEDIAVRATEVHHKVPVESAKSFTAMEQLAYDYNNLQSLCHDCHQKIHKEMFSFSKEKVIENNKRKVERFEEKFFK